MKTFRHIIATAIGTLAVALPAHSQILRAAYHTDGYSYRHMLNPAMVPDRSYFSLPIVGNTNISLQSAIGLSDVLYPTENGQLTTFMSPTVGADEFLGKLKKNNSLNFNLDMSIWSFGFYGINGFTSVDVNLKSHTTLNMPKGLFELMKKGMTSTETTYDLSNFGFKTDNYGEVALGHAHRLKMGLIFGVKLKMLLGIMNARMEMSEMSVKMAEDVWSVKAKGELTAALKGLSVPTKAEAGEEYDESDFDVLSLANFEMNTGDFGVGGLGGAIDLGLAYTFFDKLEISAGVTDLGFFKWNNTMCAATSGDEWCFEGFQDIGIISEENTVADQATEMVDDLKSLVNFHKVDVTESKAKMLGANITFGLAYSPIEQIKLGALGTMHRDASYSWNEVRLSTNFLISSWFDLSASYAFSTYGRQIGWVFNVHPRGFELYFGSDSQFFDVTPQYIPTGKINANICFGICIPVGHWKPFVYDYSKERDAAAEAFASMREEYYNSTAEAKSKKKSKSKSSTSTSTSTSAEDSYIPLFVQ